MCSFKSEEDLPLQGTIVEIPLTIENETASITLSKRSIWIHVSKADYEPSAEPDFINISLVSIWEEGYYHTTINKQNIYNIFENSSSRKIKIDRENTYDVFTDLFPLDLDTFLESDRKNGVHKLLFLSARIKVPESSFKKGESLNTDTLQIQIKSTGTFNPTIGKFDLTSVVFETSKYLKNEGNLFNWMSLLNYQNKEMVKRLTQYSAENERLQTDNNLLQQGMDQTKNDYEEIRVDLESKFYQELNLKKDVIYELSKNDLPKTELLGLNVNFLVNAAEQRNGKEANTMKSRKTQEKRVKKEKGTSTKKRKIKPGEDESEEEFADFKNDTDYADVGDKDETVGHLTNVKVKAKNEPDGDLPMVEFDFGPRVQLEPNTQNSPRSPELRDDSNAITIKPDPYANSAPFNLDSFSLDNEESQCSLSLLSGSRNSSMNIESDRGIFNNAMRDNSSGGNDEAKHEEEGGTENFKDETEYSTDESGNASGYSLDEDGEAKDKAENEEENQDTDNTENGSSSRSKNYRGSFIEDSLGSNISKSKSDENNESRNKADYSDEESKGKKDYDSTKSQQTVSQAEVETDYSDDDDDD